MSEPLNPQNPYAKSVVEPMFKHDPINIAFQKRFDLEVKNIDNDPNYSGHMTYPPVIDEIIDFVSLRPIQGDQIKTAEEGGVTATVFKTDKPGVYLIVRSVIDEGGKARVTKSLSFWDQIKLKVMKRILMI